MSNPAANLGLLLNSVGADIILPIFTFFQLRIRSQKPNILAGDAKAFIPTLAAASCLPSLIAVVPPLLTKGQGGLMVIKLSYY